MSNIGVILKDEIKRLARRVVRQESASLHRDVIALKRQAARDKRTIFQLQRDSARLLVDLRARLAAPPVVPQKELEHARLSPRLIRAQRARLGLSRESFGKLAGVSAGAVLAWEGGHSKPRADAKAALVALRGLGKREARWRLEALSSNGRRPAESASGGKTAVKK